MYIARGMLAGSASLQWLALGHAKTNRLKPQGGSEGAKTTVKPHKSSQNYPCHWNVALPIYNHGLPEAPLGIQILETWHSWCPSLHMTMC